MEGGVWKHCAPCSQPEPVLLQDYACSIKPAESPPANNSLERTQPGRDVMSGVDRLRRSARGHQTATSQLMVRSFERSSGI
jgi:hypothetical protein